MLGIFLMTVVKQIPRHHVRFGGETHSGWLPQGAMIPTATPTRDVMLDITIESDGGGYLLCWVSADLAISGDLWYETLADAERAASENFAVTADQWESRA